MTTTIAALEMVSVRVPLGRTYRGSHYQMTHRSTLITRLHLSDGTVGEIYNGDEDAANAEILGIVRHEIAPKIIGSDALQPEKLSHATRQVTFNILRDRKISQVARACVDASLWDAI